MTNPINLSQLHRCQSQRLGRRAALRFKWYGLYRDVSWLEYRAAADLLASALVDYGIEPGDRVAILSENRVEWLIADLGILSTGAADVPIHTPLTAEQVQFQLRHSGARIALVSGEQQAAKVLRNCKALPELELVVAFDALDALALQRAGISKTSSNVQYLPWQALLQQGRSAAPRCAEQLRSREAALGSDDLATILYTSGTTGEPKGVMLTHGNFLSNATATAAHSPFNEDDVLLSWLPYSHVYARLVDHYLNLVTGGTICLAEGMDQLEANLQEIRPTVMTAVPRFYEKVWAAFEALPAQQRNAGLKHYFGPRLRWLTSGGAPLPRHVAEGFLAAGVQIMEGYGLTESSPVICFNRFEGFKFGTVGQAVPGVEIRIAEDGEILTRGPHVMKGYWNNPEATAEALEPDGWLHTGDVGAVDAGGFLTITDRKKDLIVTSTGKNVAPQLIERLLTADPLIEQALVYGDDRPFLTAIIVPNFAALQVRAAELGVSHDARSALIGDPAVSQLIQQRVDAAMQSVSKTERVRKFLLLEEPFTVEAEEMTTTMKLRRRKILGKYQDALEALYASTDGANEAPY